jgi:hypothetical protein
MAEIGGYMPKVSTLLIAAGTFIVGAVVTLTLIRPPSAEAEVVVFDRGDIYLVTELENGSTPWRKFRGTGACLVRGTFDGATVDFETIVGLLSAPVETRLVNTDTGLTGLTAPTTQFLPIDFRSGYYRVTVAGGGGSVDVDVECRL